MTYSIATQIRVALAGIAGALLLSGCPKQDSPAPSATLFISLDTNTKAEVAFVTSFLDEFSFRTSGYRWLVVDVQQGHKVHNRYSNPPSEKAVEELLEKLTEIPSDDEALLSALAHAKEYVRKVGKDEQLKIVIVTAGTSSPQVLTAIQKISKELVPHKNISLFVAGVSEEHRLLMSQAFSAIDNRVQFFGAGNAELSELLRVL
jgi:hypothetical protein